jgi:hypothetical protein
MVLGVTKDYLFVLFPRQSKVVAPAVPPHPVDPSFTYSLYMFQTKSVFGPYAYGPDQICILIWFDHTRMVINELD